MNNTVAHKNWFQRNRIWLITIAILFVLFIFSLPKDFPVKAAHMFIGYSDTALADSAISIANKNDRIKQILGDLQPRHQMTLLEGYVTYSSDLDSVFMAFAIKGTKGKGMLDIYAYKKNNTWHYERLTVRLKEPKYRKQSIPIPLNLD